MINKVTSFDRATCNLIGPEILEAIKPVAEKYGLEVTQKGGTYATYKWNAKFELVAPEGAAESDSKTARLFGAHFDVGFEFRDNGKTYRVTGFNTKRPKNDTELVRLDDGRLLKCNHDYVNRFAVQFSTAGKNGRDIT